MHCSYSALDGERDAVAAAEAQRRDAALQVSALQRVEQRRQHAAAARADRVAERDSAAVDVHLRRIDAELVEHGDRLHGERLVQLEEIDVLQIPAGLLRDAGARLPPASSARASARGRWSPGRRCAPAARGRSDLARSAAITTSADAPSLTPGALPAVTVPSFLNAGFSAASDSAVVSARIASSRSTIERRALLLRNRDRQDLVLERSPRSVARAAF